MILSSLDKLKNGYIILKKILNKRERPLIIAELNANKNRYFNTKKIFFFTSMIYLYFYFVFMKNNERLRLRYSITRSISRKTKFMTSLWIPSFLRPYIYGLYTRMYGVNIDEMSKNYKDYKNFTEFFTRQLKDGARTIENLYNPSTICSPCDGNVLSCGEIVDNKIECVKGNTYTLEEFLFSFKSENQFFIKKTEEVLQRDNKLMFAVIYLCPGDYHRYHSPAYFSANYRRHIAGYLEPVRPSYIEKHKDVFKENERVNVFGEWIHGFFSISFVGALNVGSIILHFDEELNTNVRKPKFPYITDKNYKGESTFTVPLNGKNDIPLDEFIDEFDIKDIVDTDNLKKLVYHYNEKYEHKLEYNILNNFKKNKGESPLIDKLETSKEKEFKDINDFSFSDKGVELKKGEEIGYFSFGSTIVLIFECPKNYEFNFIPGDKVLLGRELLRIKK